MVIQNHLVLPSGTAPSGEESMIQTHNPGFWIAAFLTTILLDTFFMESYPNAETISQICNEISSTFYYA